MQRRPTRSTGWRFVAARIKPLFVWEGCFRMYPVLRRKFPCMLEVMDRGPASLRPLRRR